MHDFVHHYNNNFPISFRNNVIVLNLETDLVQENVK